MGLRMDSKIALSYIMHKFTDLQGFGFKDTRFLLDRSIIDGPNPNPTLVGKFLSFANEIPYHRVSISAPESKIPDILSSFWGSSPSKFRNEKGTKNQLAIKSLKGRASVAFSANNNNDDDIEKPATIEILSKTTSDNRTIASVFTIGTEEISGLCVRYIKRARRSSRESATKLDLIQKVGHLLGDLHIESSGDSADSLDDYMCLRDIFRVCIQLNKLTIANFGCCTYEEVRCCFNTFDKKLWLPKNNYITDLTLDSHVNCGESFLHNVSQALPNLKNLMLNDVEQAMATNIVKDIKIDIPMVKNGISIMKIKY
jgi:hypothetical protein